MPRPVHRVEIVGYITDTPAYQRHIPDSPGLWYCELIGTRLRVMAKRETGELVFPAGEYAEEETPVTYLERYRGSRAWHYYTRVYPLIEV